MFNKIKKFFGFADTEIVISPEVTEPVIVVAPEASTKPVPPPSVTRKETRAPAKEKAVAKTVKKSAAKAKK